MFSDRVNIQYSVDVEELPDEVLRLIGRAADQSCRMQEEGMRNLRSLMENSVMSVATLEELDRVRRQLAATDYILNDVMNIVSGSLEFKGRQAMGTTQEDDQAPPMPELEEMPEPQELHANMLFKDLDGLQNKVNKLNSQSE